MALTKVTGSVIKDSVSLSGNVSIGGTLTYQDVTNVDAIGLGTFRAGISITGGDLTIPDSIIHLGDTNTKIRFPSADTITAETGGLERVRIQSNGKVGINTNNPLGDMLTVCEFNSGTEIYENIALRLQGSSGQNVALQFTDTTGAAAYIAVQGDALRLGTNNAERLRITSGGKFGFGTSSPYTYGVATFNDSNGIVLEGSSQGRLLFRHTGGGTNLKMFDLASSDGVMKFRTIADNGTTVTERLRISSTGKIGMGERSTSASNTCDPDGNQLLIRGASTFQTAKGHIMLTGDSATVGQGPQIVFSESGSGSNNAGAYIGHVRQGSNSIGDLVFGTRGISGDANTVPTERLRIDSAGNVGVGTNVVSDSSGNARAFTIARSDVNGQVRLILKNQATGFGNGAGYHQGIDGANVFIENRTNGGYIDFATFDSGGSYGSRLRIDSDGVSGDVKNNFLLNEFKRTDTSSQHGALSTSFSTDNTINLTINGYQRGQRLIIRACVPCGIALQNGSGQNYAGTSVRVKVTGNTSGASTYSNDRPVWYRADGVGTHETVQNVFICVYIPETSTDFTNGETLTITLEGKKNSGTGTSTHYLGGWSSVKEITSERYIREL